jgi:hypothetical protein
MVAVRVAVVLVLGLTVIILALMSLGLISIPGTGQPSIRFQRQDVSSRPEPRTWTFEDVRVGSLPPAVEVLSEPRFGAWAVREEPDTPSRPSALCQTGMAEFPSIAIGTDVYSDVVMSAAFKPISGRVDQAAGLLFRVQDKDNYYILRANALEGNVNFYKYAGGRRSALKEGPVSVTSGTWQELRLEALGNQFRGFLNGQPVVEATDDTYLAGRIGLWTKADSTTCFDDVRVEPR